MAENVNLPKVCRLLNGAYRSEKDAMVARLKAEVEATNRLHHQCGAPDETDLRLKPPCKIPYSNDPGLAKWIPFDCYNPSFYDLKKNEGSIGGAGLNNRTQSTTECEPYYRALFEQKRTAAENLKKQKEHDVQLIKRSLIQTQSIK